MAYTIDLTLIEETAALGLTRWKELATACGCSTDTLENIRKTDGGAIEEARRRGMARAQETVARALMKRVQAGDTGALKIAAAHIIGWHTHHKPDDSAANVPSLRIILSSALPPPQVEKVINGCVVEV